MCGRFAFYSPAEAVAALFGVQATAPVEPRYNIAPTQTVAVVRVLEDRRELAMLRWGLVPFWAKDPSIGNRMINARAETVAEKPAYRAAYRKRRCLVLADGFYEWHREGNTKTPYYISQANGAPFAFAGLWEAWTDKETEDRLQTTTIVTMAANNYLAQVHHRMPVVLSPDTADCWLGGDTDLLDGAADCAPELRAWSVARSVNNARNEGSELIEAAGDTLI